MCILDWLMRLKNENVYLQLNEEAGWYIECDFGNDAIDYSVQYFANPFYALIAFYVNAIVWERE